MIEGRGFNAITAENIAVHPVGNVSTMTGSCLKMT